jgi:L-threonylcarbamoyladenylate synthase
LTTRVLSVDPDRPDPSILDEAASVLRSGGLVAFATETVYGLGAIATDARAVARIFAAKGRPSFNPLIVHVASVDQAKECTSEWPEAADRLARAFWPGPLTIVLPRSSIVPEITTGGQSTVAVRMPSMAVARRLVERTGRPLAAPSANRSNRVSPTRAEHVLADLGDRVDLVLDSGPAEFGLESTVLSLTHSPARVLRPGPVGLEALAACLDGMVEVGTVPSVASPGAIASPGMLPTHYAPRTPALRVESLAGLERVNWPGRAAVLTFGTPALPPLPGGVEPLALPGAASAAASQLYAALHELDARRLDLLVVVMPPEESEWRAVRDRLVRATQPQSPGPIEPGRGDTGGAI